MNKNKNKKKVYKPEVNVPPNPWHVQTPPPAPTPTRAQIARAAADWILSSFWLVLLVFFGNGLWWLVSELVNK